MKTCQNCGRTLDGSAAFCDQCGMPAAPAAPICAGCGEPLEAGASFCSGCGSPVAAEARPTVAAGAYQPQGMYQPGGAPPAAAAGGSKKLPVKVLMIAAGAVVIIAAALIALFILKPAANATLLYLKDEELSLTGLKNIEPFELTDELYDDEAGYMGYNVAYRIKTSENGRYLFYPQEIGDDDTYDLFRIDLKANNAKKSTAVRVASGISDYRISPDGGSVIYLDGDRLYISDITDKVKIDSDVMEFYVNEDCTRVIYLDSDGELYYSDSANWSRAEKLDSDAELEQASDDLSRIWYLKNDALYFLEIGRDKVKIDSDIEIVAAVYDSGEAYYSKYDEQLKPLMDFVTDDMVAADAAITEPDYDDYTTIVTNAYGYTYEDIDYDAYNEAYSAYLDKLDRDELREDLASERYSLGSSSLFYYDGSKSVEITDQLGTVYQTGEQPMIIYNKPEAGNLPKILLSELVLTTNVTDIIDDAIGAEGEDGAPVFIAIGAAETEIDQDKADSFIFDPAGTALYFLDNISDKDDAAELYQIRITRDTVSAPELYDEDVASLLRVFNGNQLLYFKDYDEDDYSGDLYIDQTRIDTDVYLYGFTTLTDRDYFYYFADVDDDGIGTLKLYDGKKAVKIADDIFDYLASDEKNVVYLSDYDIDDGEGDAYLYNGSREPALIDRNVSYLLRIS